jgi:hypothetical protein
VKSIGSEKANAGQPAAYDGHAARSRRSQMVATTIHDRSASTTATTFLMAAVATL